MGAGQGLAAGLSCVEAGDGERCREVEVGEYGATVGRSVAWPAHDDARAQPHACSAPAGPQERTDHRRQGSRGQDSSHVRWQETGRVEAWS